MKHAAASYIVSKVKLSLCFTNQALRHEGVWGSGCVDPHFLDLGTSWRWVVSFTPRRFTRGERAHGTHWIGGWAGPRAGLDDVEKRTFLILPGLELRILDCPAGSQSLYRLSCPGSYLIVYFRFWLTLVPRTFLWNSDKHLPDFKVSHSRNELSFYTYKLGLPEIFIGAYISLRTHEVSEKMYWVYS
jgi:hypothetical protein